MASAIDKASYREFCAEFFDCMKRGTVIAANNILESNKPYYRDMIRERNPFKAQIESLLQDETVDKPHRRIVRMVRMVRVLENHGFVTDEIRVFELGGLIAVWNDEDASKYLKKYPHLSASAKLLLSAYKNSGRCGRHSENAYGEDCRIHQRWEVADTKGLNKLILPIVIASSHESKNSPASQLGHQPNCSGRGG